MHCSTSIEIEYNETTNDSLYMETIDVWNRALSRGLGECAVCMCSNDSGAKGGVGEQAAAVNSRLTTRTRIKPVAVLSCSHVFHDRCIHSFELYNNKSDSIQLCPMCRTPYEKKVIKAW